MPKLLIKHPEKGDLSFTLSGGRVSVGRRAENSIQINHGTVSGSHAELVAVNGHYVLRDLGSTNHSFLNGERVSEDVDLKEACKITFGTVECDYIPDNAKPAPTANGSDLDTLRKNVGILRSQNDELVAKLADQKQQIEILGSAKLLMRPSNGADPVALKEKLTAVTAERDGLRQQNEALQNEITMLRALAQNLSGGSPSSDNWLKETVPITLPPTPRLPIAVTSAPVPKAVTAAPQADILHYYGEIVAKMRPLVANLRTESEARNEMLLLARHLVEKSPALGNHPVGRMAKALEGILRDISESQNEAGQNILRSITHGIDTLARILEPRNLAKCPDLPQPSVLVVDDDSDFLPAMLAALEFARLPVTGCPDATQALTLLGESRFDLIVLDLGLPDFDGLDLCAAVRNLPYHSDTPILILTGSDSIENRAQSSIRGSSDFLAKPCNLFDLTLRSYSWVYNHQLGLL